MLALPLVLTLATLAGVLAIRRWPSRVPSWAWYGVDLLPALILLLGAWLEGKIFEHAGRFTPKYSPLMLWAGACAVAWPAWPCFGRVRAIASGVLLTLSSLIVIGDLWYLRFFGGLAPILAVGSGGQLWAVRDSLWELTRSSDLGLLPLFGLGVLMAVWWPVPARVLNWKIQLASGLLALVLVTLGTLPIKRDLENWLATHHSWKIFNSKILITDAGLWGAHARDIAQSVREARQTKELSQKRREEIGELHRRRNAARSPVFGTATGKNLLLIQIEAMQQWVVEAKIRGEPVMPFLQELRGRGVYYSNVWDQTGGSPTADCEYMVFASQHPLTKGSVAFRRAGNHLVGLAELLAQHGYQTFSAHAYSPSMWNRSVLHPKYGFQQSAFEPELGSKPKLGWGLEDVAFFERSVPLIDELSQPWFAFLISLTSHHPYTYIPTKRHEFTTPGLGRALGGYLHSMRYVDHALRSLFAKLEEAHLSSDTLVAIYGDHDSKLTFASGEQKAAAKLLDLDTRTLKDLGRRSWVTKKIPLLLLPPNPTDARIEPTIGGQIDIGPSLLDWLGLPKSTAYLGQALDSADNDQFVARHDGSAVNRELMWDGQSKRCYDQKKGKKTSKKRCKALRAAARRELEASWDVTLNDLARELHEQTP